MSDFNVFTTVMLILIAILGLIISVRTLKMALRKEFSDTIGEAIKIRTEVTSVKEALISLSSTVEKGQTLFNVHDSQLAVINNTIALHEKRLDNLEHTT